MNCKFSFSRTWLVFLLCIMPGRAFSDSTIDFEVDGLAYHITSEEERTVSVTKDCSDDWYMLDYPQYDGDIIVPATVIYDNVEFFVTSIGRAFRYSVNLRSISLPEGITELESSAFDECHSLERIYLPNTLKRIGSNAFYNCFALTKLTIPESITEVVNNIGLEDSPLDTLFIKCPEIRFTNLKVKHIVLGETVRTVRSFSYCRNLESVDILGETISFGEGCFYGCDSLKKLYIPGRQEVVSKNFLSGSYIESLVLGEGITTITNFALEGNTNLREIKFPQSLREIGRSAFSGCSKLSSITLPPKCTYLDYKAFAGCSSIAYVSVECDSIAFTIPGNAFDENVYENAILYVKKGMKSLFEKAEAWNWFQTIIDDEEPDTTLVTFFDSDNVHYHVMKQKDRIVEVVRGEEPYKGDITIPIKVTYANKEYTVKSIDDYAFSITSSRYNWHNYNDSIISVWIEEGVESIGECAFFDCRSLTSINLPSSIKYIGSSAFENCSSLTSINLPSTLNELGANAFMNCSSLTSIQLPENLSRIEPGTYSGLRSLTSLTIPSCVEYIGTYAFSNLGVPSVTIPKSVYRIGRGAFNDSSIKKVDILGSPHIEYGVFRGCEQLENVTFHASLRSLHTQAFMDCKSLKSISLPEGLKMIDYHTFSGCENLREINLPASLEQLQPSAFGTYNNIIELHCGCDSIQVIRVADGGACYDSREDCNAVIDKRTNTLVLGCQGTVIPSGVVAIGDEAFRGQGGFTNINIPEGVTSIGHYAFAGCKDLERAELPQSLTSIGWCAFEDCVSLTSILIPESVTTMGYWAFWGCNNLESVEVKSTQPYAIDAQAFLSGICQPIDVADIILPVSTAREDICIYSLDGRLLKTLPANEGHRMADGLKRNEIYIIRMGEKVQKVRL